MAKQFLIGLFWVLFIDCTVFIDYIFLYKFKWIIADKEALII